MKEIYVLDEHGNLQLIDAGVDSYHELTDAPIKTTYNGVTLVGSSVENGVVIPATDPADIHKWSAAELLSFCESAQSGRYDIITEEMGTEILMIDNTDADLGRRYRRITADQDLVYDINAGWISISDSSARALVFRINNLSAIPSTLVVGNRLVLECYYYSTVGNGNITIMKGERTVAAASLEVGKTTTITLTSEVTDGINEFRYLVTNNGFGSLERQQTGTIGITGIQLLYNPRFNELQIQRGDVNFPVSYSGTGTKFANFKITKPDGSSTEFSDRSIPLVNDGGTTFTLSADHFAHGANIIETYMYMMDGNSDAILTRTDPVTYNFPYVVDNAKPIVMTYFDYSTLQEWDTVSVPYRIWASENMSSIKFEIQYTQEDGVAQFVQQTYDGSKEANVNNYLTKDVEHKWQISNLPHGELIFRIHLNGEVEPYYESEVVNVAKSSYDFKTVGGYLFNFAANDVVSTEAFSEWDSNGYTMKLENFNFFTDGIVTEVDKGLKFSSASRATLDVDKSLFDYAAGSEGTTIEFDFKVDDNADNTKPIIRYGAWDEPTASWSNRFGIIVYPTKAVLNYDTKSAAEEALLVNFQKGERINLGFVIEPQSASDTHHYIKIFINGILSKVIRYISGDSTKFPDNTKHFAFNVSGNEFYLYGFRAYKTLLSSSQMLQNYISNFASVDTKVSMLGANNIFSNNTITLKNGDSLTGEYYASFSKVKGKIGCLVMIMDKLPETKDYLPCHTIYYEKDENNPEVETHSSGRSMATTYYFKDGVLNKEIKVGAQGTSSLEYPRKNFKFKYKDKFYIKGHKKGKDKTFTMKAD